MRLLDVHRSPPPAPEDDLAVPEGKYAILSHTWRHGEITLSDLRNPEGAKGKAGWEKLRSAQQQAARDGYDTIWIDTCCIDKTSSTELSETINSMYGYYKESAVCYVYLDDVADLPSAPDSPENAAEDASLRDDDRGELLHERLVDCRWFRRGWTLQELLAPKAVRFYDRSWNFLGTLQDLAHEIHKITNIHISMLQHESRPSDFSVAQRMSWAAFRETTRPEDRAYSLLGILDVNLDVRYGEGARAFIRLQEEIIARSSDQSVFAWDQEIPGERFFQYDSDPSSAWSGHVDWCELLARSPDAFSTAGDIVCYKSPSPAFHMTNTGLNITGELRWLRQETKLRWTFARGPHVGYYAVLLLHCYSRYDPKRQILLRLSNGQPGDHPNANARSWHVAPRPKIDRSEQPYGVLPGSRLKQLSAPSFTPLAGGPRTITIARTVQGLPTRLRQGGIILIGHWGTTDPWPVHQLCLQVIKRDGVLGQMDMTSPSYRINGTHKRMAREERSNITVEGVRLDSTYQYLASVSLQRGEQTITVHLAFLPEWVHGVGVMSIVVGSPYIDTHRTDADRLLTRLQRLHREATPEGEKDYIKAYQLSLTQTHRLSTWVVFLARLEVKEINGTKAYFVMVRTVFIIQHVCERAYRWLTRVPLAMYVMGGLLLWGFGLLDG